MGSGYDGYGRTTRRRFLQRGTLLAGGASLALGPACSVGGSPSSPSRPEALRLAPDRGGMLDLPPGFQYRVLSEEGGRLSNGARVPGSFDGMAALPGAAGQTILMRNHELGAKDGSEVPAKRPFDRDGPGGTSMLVVGPDRRLLREVVTSSGTIDNCAGGATPWGTWITCEETFEDGHGHAFEVDPGEPEGELSRTPIRAMGTLSHEAVAFDPRGGAFYLTEDHNPSGLDDPDLAGPSFLYRYVPFDARRRPGALQGGGLLQALTLEERSPRPGALDRRRRFGVTWRLVDPGRANEDAQAKGCAAFVRIEGCAFGAGALWFADTLGGDADRGQLFRYRPSTGTLELFHESGERSRLEQPDNMVVAPWGDLVVCSDSRSDLFAITARGDLNPIARSRLEDSELCGPTFAADGRTLFLNAQYPGVTYAIWGPFGRFAGGDDDRALRDPDRRRRMAVAAPPRGEGPVISQALAEAGDRHGLTRLEAAAFDRLGAQL